MSSKHHPGIVRVVDLPSIDRLAKQATEFAAELAPLVGTEGIDAAVGHSVMTLIKSAYSELAHTKLSVRELLDSVHAVLGVTCVLAARSGDRRHQHWMASCLACEAKLMIADHTLPDYQALIH